MAAVAFDPLEYTHQLEASGVPREQAEVHAKAMTALFLHNFDALVTKDYLDSRFNEFETRVEAGMDKRFADMEVAVDKRCTDLESRIDKRFVDMEVAVGKRFTDMESRIDKRFVEMEVAVDKRFTDMESRIDKRIMDMEVGVDERFAGAESRIDKRFVGAESVMNQRFAEIDLRLEHMDGRFNLLYWMQGLTIACVVVPVIHGFWG